MLPAKVVWLLTILFYPALGEINFKLPEFKIPTVLSVSERLEQFQNDSEIFMSTKDAIFEKLSEFKQTKLTSLPNKGANLLKLESGSLTASQVLEKKADKGIVLRIENYSHKLLADPIRYIRCGYEDKEYPVFSTLAPGAIDIAMLHNKDKSLRSSCGSISWQIMDRKSKPTLLSDGRGVRLFLVWTNLDNFGSNKCRNGKRNEFVVGIQKVDMDATSHYQEYDKKALYKLYIEDDQADQSVHATTRNSSSGELENSLSVFGHSKETDLKVLAEMGSGCLTDVSIKLLGERDSALEDFDVGFGEEKTPDEVWEQMIRQSWLDIVSSINKDRSLYGIGLEPLMIDPLVKEEIYVNTSSLGYEIQFWMWNISIDGLSDLKLDRLILERGPALKNLDTKAILNLGNLTVKGTYKFQAKYTGWVWGMSDLDSEGEQPFNISLTNAKFKIELGMDTVNGCNRTSDLIFTYLGFPLDYDAVEFNFANLGGVLSSVVGIVGGMAISLSETAVVDAVKNVLKSEVDTLLCGLPNKPAEIGRIAVNVDERSEPRWHEILSNGTRGWGINSLRRDILAEKFVTKIFNDGVAKHFANPNDTLSKLLDPFQNLPISEPFRKRGLVKGHVVVCNFWLYGLRRLNLIDMQLARNEDLTYSALKVKIGIPDLAIKGQYRLNKVKVFSVIPAAKSEGTMDIALKNVTVDLYVVLRAKQIRDQGNASIAIENFEVNFGKDDVDFKITGLAKGLNKIANKLVDLLGNKILDIQRNTLNKEIKNIIWGIAECVMYKPAMGMTKCLDAFWESLGFEVPFTFPPCQEMFDKADKTPLPF